MGLAELAKSCQRPKLVVAADVGPKAGGVAPAAQQRDLVDGKQLVENEVRDAADAK